MKFTGRVRCVDDLGRVVIPKYIRKQLGIHEGDPMSIYVDNDMVCYAKYDDNMVETKLKELSYFVENSYLNKDTVKEIRKHICDINEILGKEV